ncbi:beta-glucan synthesis-associated [Dichomitus squalens]|uniref:Beta-glucan synthesis-associated n=2 Tax=Dichomitus squalens TaxID=114155 RepID=A0A4Q9N7W4_9APHY|nr:beta-glucan synthesis-associated [Dichomitus squalens LYAD-421 SS1]EJF62408.1 beta-glucan synthesis-associated [Dichomitus squalens LYAD-421 SS1]TBU36854.1 beta-glucan synthesis-associated [Dichomitus squalens]TBU63118.1 beta-glucan synthesis-associated [Dichomitus squalens]
MAASTPPPPSTSPFDSAEGSRNSKGSISSYPSSASRLLSETLPSLPRRLTSYGSSPSLSVASDSPYLGPSRPLSLGDLYTLSPDPQTWGTHLLPEDKEDDDDLHKPDPELEADRHWADNGGDIISRRGIVNLGALLLLITAVLILFIGYPVITAVRTTQSTLGAFNLGGINASGQVPDIPGHRGLIDIDTPKSAYKKTGWRNGEQLELVFSDEFNVDGRTFYPGDDPYWEAVDLHYWETNNLEWYDPEAIATEGGNLVITLSQKQTHNLSYQGGMMSTWNKFCFTGGYIETNVSLPGVNNILGLWPAIWTMGNLGRAGYGASLEGMWPYTYDTCDVGTVANQTINGQPAAATVDGDQGKGGVLSYLPGQRLSRCTCPGESHPGPKHSDGTFVGRAAPEIDVFEAQIDQNTLIAQVSQSAQWAPFNHAYIWQNTSDNEIITDPSISQQNTFTGSATQQATSVVTATDPNCYEYETGCYSIYGFEYKPGFEDGYITWISNNQVSWTLNGPGMGPDSLVEIQERPVPGEPMYIIMNLGMSFNFGPVDLAHLPFPVHMRVDYIRVYQPSNAINIGCDPKDYPTAAYIEQYLEAYSNPNLTTWSGDYKQPWPKNSFLGEC